MNNLRRFANILDYSAATLNYPAVSWIVSGNTVAFDAEAPVFGGLTVYYSILDTEHDVALFNGGGSSSESGGGGVLPDGMIVDGVEETPINTWRFETAGEHIVQYTFENNEIPAEFLCNVNNNLADITKIEIGNNITAIPDASDNGGVFENNQQLSSVTIGNGVTSIGEYAFYECSSLTSVTIPDSVTSIGEGVFSNCSSLTSITIPDSVTSIGTYVFNNCSGLTSVTIGSGVTSIGDYAFSNCNGLTSITIPDSVTSIGTYVFNNCSGLTSITIPDSVTSIGRGAFDSCSDLTSVTVLATTPPSIGSGAFYSTNDCPIYVPAGSVSAYKSATNWSSYASRIQAIP